MSADDPSKDQSNRDRIIAEARQYKADREKEYREQALKLFPWVCARCGREFSGKRLRELTVHHKDHDHDNNPPDGSNWELLCIYCHDNEHARYEEEHAHGPGETDRNRSEPMVTHSPFANLAAMLKDKK
jgi:hypothetical protein